MVTTDLKNGYHYRGLDPLAYNTNKSFIEQNNSQRNIGAIIFNNYDQPGWLPLLISLDVDYVLENKDNFFESGRLTLEEIKKSQGGFDEYFAESKRWGNLSLYEIRKEKNLPKIYVGGVGEKTLVANLPKITFARVSPVAYRVEVSRTENEFLLVFSEGFSPTWKAYVSPSSKAIAEERHLVVNGFTNGWLIKPKDIENRKTFEIIIKYAGQQYFYLGATITGISFLALILVRFLPKFKL